MRGNHLVTDSMFQGIISLALTILMFKKSNIQENLGIQVYKLRLKKKNKKLCILPYWHLQMPVFHADWDVIIWKKEKKNKKVRKWDRGIFSSMIVITGQI